MTEQNSAPEPFTTKRNKPQQASRGPNITPKATMRSGRNWDHHSWLQALSAAAKKWDKEAAAHKNKS